MIKRIGLPFHQWELDRQISVENVEFDEIHFYNKISEKALVTEPSSNIANIPNILLQSAENICVFVMKDEKVVEHTSFGVCQRKQPEDYVYTETEHFTYANIEKRLKELEGKSNGFNILTWHIDTDSVIDSDGNAVGTLANCMTDEYVGTWFYVITSTSDTGSSPYPSQYTIDGANGYLSLRDYVVWTGDRLVHIPTFEAKASDIINSDGQYSPRGGVDGLMSSTDKAYLGDLTERFVAACQAGNKNSGNNCGESGLYGNIVSGRPTPVIDKDTPVGNLMAIRDKVTGCTSQVLIGETTEKSDSLHYDMWFKGNKEAAQWMRALTSDNLIRFVNTDYTGYVNWATAPGIYKVKANSADGDRAFTQEHIMFVIPGAPEPDSAYLATAVNEDRVKMRSHAITQLAVSQKGAIRVRYCPLPKLNNSVSGYCIGWYDLLPEVGGMSEIEDESVTTEKLTDGAVTSEKLSQEVKDMMGSSDVIIIDDVDATVKLTENVREIVAKGDVNLKILLPENPWSYWRCTINLTEAQQITIFDVGFYNGDMFCSDGPWETPQAGKTYMLMRNNNQSNNPNDYNLYEVDNITRLPITEASTAEGVTEE